MKITGTVEHVDLEGGLWRLNGDDGKRYTLLGASSELKSAKGARVEVEGSLDEGFGIGMAGPQLRVQKLRKI
jgi:hypothetical protein